MGSGDADLLLARLKAVALADSAVRKDVLKSIRELRLPKTFSELGPTEKLPNLRQSTVKKGNPPGFSHIFTYARPNRCTFLLSELFFINTLLL